MKKLLTIFLMALYAMSVAASIVTVRSCDVMQATVNVSVIDNKDCCCGGAHCLDIDRNSEHDRTLKMVQSLVKINQGSFHQAPDEQSGSYVNTQPAKQKTCCTEIVLQSHLVANLPGNMPGVNGFDLVAHPLPAVPFRCITCLVPSIEQHKWWTAIRQTAPPQLALYKLFKRLTYYG